MKAAIFTLQNNCSCSAIMNWNVETVYNQMPDIEGPLYTVFKKSEFAITIALDLLCVRAFKIYGLASMLKLLCNWVIFFKNGAGGKHSTIFKHEVFDA